MRLTLLPKLRLEDFPPDVKWLGKLFIQLNPYIEAINNVINGNLDFVDNIAAVTKSYSISTFQEFSILWPFNNSPQSCQIVSALKGSPPAPCFLLLAWSYNATTQSVTISNMLEVTSSGNFNLNGSYQFTVRVSV